MMKALSIAAIALMMAGSSAFACGCEKDTDKGSSKVIACKGDKEKKPKDATSEQTACNGKKKKSKDATSEQTA